MGYFECVDFELGEVVGWYEIIFIKFECWC